MAPYGEPALDRLQRGAAPPSGHAGPGGQKVTVNDYGHFFGCGFEGALERVQTLPPDDTAVRLVLSGGTGFFLDPADVEVFVGGGFSEGATWLEFRLTGGPTVAIEAAMPLRR